MTLVPAEAEKNSKTAAGTIEAQNHFLLIAEAPGLLCGSELSKTGTMQKVSIVPNCQSGGLQSGAPKAFGA
jgi:hypothetical protein